MFAWMFVAALLGGPAFTEQLQLATVGATVLDARDQPVAGAALTLTDGLGAELQRTTTDAGGRALFVGVAPGRYLIHTEAPGAAAFDMPVTVAAALPLELTVRIPATVTDAVRVEASADDPSSRDSLAAETLARLPVRIRARGLQEAVASLPGWVTEDNGLLHARGVDDGFLYVIDGVPVYERLDAVSGIAPDLTGIESITVVTGYVPPEFGYKAGGVIDIRSAVSRPAWQSSADLTVGSFASRDGAFSSGGRLGSTVDLRAGVTAVRSERYLDPIHPDNFHNTGHQSTTFGQLGWSATPRDRVTAGWGYGRSSFDVPNNDDQEEAGQDQRQRIAQGFFHATWQRAVSTNTVLQAAAYRRHTRSRLDGSPRDTPLTAHADRTLGRTGMAFAATRQAGSHVMKAGVEWQRLSLDERFGFAITDPEEAEEAGFRDEALRFTVAHPFDFADRATPRFWSFYGQDAWRASSRLTVSGGVRYDRTRQLLERSQWSPRLGGALRLGTSTLLRAAVSRFYQPPQPENLLLSSSPEARVLSAISVGDAVGGADLEPERQWGTEVGIDQPLGRFVRLDAAYWQRWVSDASDPNVFAGTTIIFPNAVAKGRARGVDVRIEMPRQRGWSGYANVAAARVVQTGPITGGLFLEDDVEELGPGVDFFPDHDQRVTAGGGFTWGHAPSGSAVSVALRYETGTPVQRDDDDEDDLVEAPGAETVDFARGRVKARTVVSLLATYPVLRAGGTSVVAGLQVLNLFDRAYAYNFGNPFSGTHFGAPRTVAFTLRVRFD
jgi:outer membrane receptor protein involved in Fe transport